MKTAVQKGKQFTRKQNGSNNECYPDTET